MPVRDTDGMPVDAPDWTYERLHHAALTGWNMPAAANPETVAQAGRNPLDDANAPIDQWYVKYLYERLGIIDNKTSALLRLNGVILGFVTVAVFRVIELKQVLVPYPGLFLAVSAVIFLLLFYAETLSFRIFYLRFDRITGPNDYRRYRETFYEITQKRERDFCSLRLASFLGTFLFSLTFLMVAAGHAFYLLAPDTAKAIAATGKAFLQDHAPWIPL